MIKLIAVILSVAVMFACKDTKPIEPPAFKQDFKSDVAWIVLEWNGRYYGNGSGFLIDKEKGAFYTNKHVSDMFDSLGKGSHKIFFNGKVYNASIIRTPVLADAALIRITDKFDSSEFPEPAPIGREEIKVADKLNIQGFHLHWHWVREADKEAGHEFPLVPILKDYYDMGTRDLDREREVVFEKLEATVEALDVKAEMDSGGNYVQEARNRSNLYIKAKTTRDHRFSFGGLSGSAVRNTKGEIIGILTIEEQRKEELDRQEFDNFTITLSKMVYNTILITSIDRVEVLRKYLN